MLDHFSISHQSERVSQNELISGGLILWSRSFTPAFSALALTPASPVNALVKESFIEGQLRGEQEGFERDGYSVRWAMENSLGLVFVVGISKNRCRSWLTYIRLSSPLCYP